MIEKITPTNVTSISSGKKQNIQNAAASKVSHEETEALSSQTAQTSQATLSKGRQTSAYLQARDVQDSVSYQQTRQSALMDVNNMLKSLRSLAMQYTTSDLSLAEQDAIVAQAEQTLYTIDKTANSSQFQGTPVISDADSRQLGLEVINLEAGDPVGLINSALNKVAAKLAMSGAQVETFDVRINNIKRSAAEIMSEYQAEQAAQSIADALRSASPDDINKDLTPEKVLSLLGI